MSFPILVCGDSMWDEYWWGDVERISPEAPVPVAKINKTEVKHGAASNVIANIEALEHETYKVFCRSRCHKIRVLARGHQLLRVDFDKTPSEAEVAEMENEFVERLTDPCKIILFSDYGKGALIHIQDLIKYATAAGKTVLVDPKGHDYTRYTGAFLIKPNVEELKAVIGGWTTEAQLREKVTALRQATTIKYILLTRAKDGMTLFGEEAYHVPSVAQEVFDVTGAGDTAIATIAVCLNEELPMQTAVLFATRAASITCQHIGAYAPLREEVFND